LGAALAILGGCHPQQPFYFHDTGDMSHYKGVAMEMEYPDTKLDSLGDVTGASAPLTLSNPEPKEIWDLTLEEAMHTALCNSKVMKQLGAAVTVQAGGTGPGAPGIISTQINSLQGSSFGSPSTQFDPAFQETDSGFGVEQALSAFDAQLQTSMIWGRMDTPQNVNTSLESGGLIIPGIEAEGTGKFQAQLSKTTASGATLSVSETVNYEADEYPSIYARFPSAYTVTTQIGISQPLLQGAGVTFNRIASPGTSSANYGGQFHGVMIARIRADISLTDFQLGLRNMIGDVENAYWELYFAYRNLDSVVAGRDAALETWRKIYALAGVGAKGGEAEKEAQAREQYFLFRSSLESALASVYKAEGNLRYMMGIAVSDGRLIRPKDEPTTAKVAFDWYQIHSEALVRNEELRRRKWDVKEAELTVIGAKNFLLPQLNAIAQYRWLGLGNQLESLNSNLDTNPNDPNTPNGRYQYALNNLMMGDFQEWNLGFQFQMNLGFRKEMADVRNAQLRLARVRAILREQELELSHQMAYALRDVDTNFVLSETNFNRRVAAIREVKAVQAAYDTGTITLDVLLNAQRDQAQAESDYYRSVVNYNESIMRLHLRKGSLLEYNDVCLSEGPWPGKAYFDAARLARARGAGHYMDYGCTRPGVISRGPIVQNAGQPAAVPVEPQPVPAGPVGPRPAVEVVPAPQPQPANPLPAVKVGPQAGNNGWTPRTPVASAARTGNTGRDLGTLDLNKLESVPAEAKSPPGSDWKVRQTTYQAASSGAGPAAQGSSSANTNRDLPDSTSGHEQPEANSPFADSDRTASGWQRAQR
jgi:outer membrane protein TolC